ncbi:MAG: cytochrome c [Bacteroidetes bacterium]|nr:cytochrome c [Bacteroidota bacterium]
MKILTLILFAGLLVSIPTSIVLGEGELQEEKSEEQTQGLNGAEVFRNNCSRCHNYRFPNQFSDAQWEIIVTHMRVRAQLTEAEAMAVLEFLQKAN